MAKRIEGKDLWNAPGVKKEAQDIATSLANIEKQLKELAKLSIQAKKAFDQQSKSQTDLANKAKKLETAKQKLNKIEQERIALTNKLNRLNSDSIQRNEELRLQIQRQVKINRELAREKLGLISAYEREKKQVDALKAKYRDLVVQGNQNTKAARELRQEIERRNARLREANMQAQQSGGFFKNMTKSILAAGAAFVSVGAAINGFIRFVQDAIKINREFEKTITNVITLLDEAQKAKYGEFIKQGALDIAAKYGLEITDVNKALFDAISAGVDAGESIEFLSKASELAIGGVTDLTTAVDGVTSVMNAYGLESSETEKITSAFFSAQKFGKTTVEELSGSIGKTGSIAKQAGVSYQELLTTFAELTKQGLSTDDAATAIKSTLTALLKPGKEAADIFDELGIEYGASALKANGLFKTLGQVSAAAEGNADILAELIPNVRALTGVGAIGTDQLAEMDSILQTLNKDFGEGSSLQSAFNEQSKTGAAQSAALKAEYQKMIVTLGGGESVFKKIGTSIRGELTKRLQGATKAIKILQDGTWVDRIKLLLNSLLKAVFATFRPMIVLIERITGKKIGFNIDVAETKDLIDESVEIVEEGEKEITEIQKKEAEERARIRQKAADLRNADERARQRDLENALLTTSREIQIKELEIVKEGFDIRKELEAAYTDYQAEQAELRLQKLKEEEAKKAEIEAAGREIKKQAEQATGQIITDQFTAGIDFRLSQSQAENEAKQQLLETRLEKGLISEEEYQKESEKLNNEFRVREAKAEKKKAIYDIFIKALVASVAALPNLIKSGLMLAKGAIASAVVAARPIPRFFRGIEDFQGGMALVGDSASGGAQTELIQFRTGEQFLVNEPTKMFLPKGTSVFPEKSKETQAAISGMDDRKIVHGLRRIEKKLSTRGGVYWTKSGLERRDNESRTRTILKGRRFI